MGKKCLPGVVCFENITIIFIVVILVAVMLFINNRINYVNAYVSTPTSNVYVPDTSRLLINPLYGSSNTSNDVLLNPYQPPIRDDRIGVRTNGYDSEYRQVGILTRMYGAEMILPLMGKPIHVARDKWNFYTMKDSSSMVKLPITYKGNSCTNEYGCDNLFNGDVVYVEGYNDTFKVTVYDNQSASYSPYL